MRYRPVSVPPGNRAVAANMARLRIKAGVDQHEFGRLLGWSNNAVSAAERSVDGKRIRKFDADEIVLIARVLGVEPADLIASPPVCEFCHGQPPAGMQCLDCGVATPRPEPAAFGLPPAVAVVEPPG